MYWKNRRSRRLTDNHANPIDPTHTKPNRTVAATILTDTTNISDKIAITESMITPIAILINCSENKNLKIGI